MKLDEVETEYKNTEEHNEFLYNEFTKLTNDTQYLCDHKNYIDNNRYGYGERAFQSMWEMIIEAEQDNFRFLEVGVFMGQIVSLIELITKEKNKIADIVGVSPFDNKGAGPLWTSTNSYKDIVYSLFDKFKLSTDRLVLLTGLSQDEKIISIIKQMEKFDIIYIDGSHTYQDVLEDLNLYSNFVKPGGLFVIDDAACYMNIKKKDHIHYIYSQGIPEVSNACVDFFTGNNNFKLAFVVGHNVVYRKEK